MFFLKLGLNTSIMEYPDKESKRWMGDLGIKLKIRI